MDFDPVRMFKALANESRLKILESLYDRDISGTCTGPDISAESCTCVGEIVDRFGLAPSTISHHVRELALAGLVRVERDGQFIRVFPNPDALDAISAYTGSLKGKAGGD